MYIVKISVTGKQAYGESAVNFTVHPGKNFSVLTIFFGMHLVSFEHLSAAVPDC